MPTEFGRRIDFHFYWPVGVDPETWYGVRRPRLGESRPLEHVSLVEIANAMHVAAEMGAGMAEGELKREALALFGGRRITEAIGARLQEALTVALEHGRIRRTPSGLYMTTSL